MSTKFLAPSLLLICLAANAAAKVETKRMETKTVSAETVLNPSDNPEPEEDQTNERIA